MGWGADHDRIVRRNKAALTRAQRSGDLRKVIAVCNAALRDFEERIGYPDDWTRWQRAKEDAEWALRVKRED